MTDTVTDLLPGGRPAAAGVRPSLHRGQVALGPDRRRRRATCSSSQRDAGVRRPRAAEVLLAVQRRTQVEDAKDEVAADAAGSRRAPASSAEGPSRPGARRRRPQVQAACRRTRATRRQRAPSARGSGPGRARAARRPARQRIKQEILAAARRPPRSGGYNGATGGFLTCPVNGPSPRRSATARTRSTATGACTTAPTSAPAAAAPLARRRPGTVISSYYDEVYGNRLYLDVGTVNGANLTLVYNHMSGYKRRHGARSAAATSSGTSAPPAGPPAATCTSRCCATASRSTR